MAQIRQSRLSSALDEMLAQNKQRLDALLRGAPSAAVGTAVPRPAAPPRLDPASSPAMRRLTERFGNDWRYEVAAQHREGGEAIVLLKLVIGKAGAVKTQFGRARLAGGPVEGKSGGLSFRLAGNPGDENEAEAYCRATEAALMKCAELT